MLTYHEWQPLFEDGNRILICAVCRQGRQGHDRIVGKQPAASEEDGEQWRWVRQVDGPLPGVRSWRLIDLRGRIRGDAWTDGTWHTWDEDGIGGENSADASVAVAKAEAIRALIRQGWIPVASAPPEQPAESAPTSGWRCLICTAELPWGDSYSRCERCKRVNQAHLDAIADAEARGRLAGLREAGEALRRDKTIIYHDAALDDARYQGRLDCRRAIRALIEKP